MKLFHGRMEALLRLWSGSYTANHSEKSLYLVAELGEYVFISLLLVNYRIVQMGGNEFAPKDSYFNFKPNFILGAESWWVVLISKDMRKALLLTCYWSLLSL